MFLKLRPTYFIVFVNCLLAIWAPSFQADEITNNAASRYLLYDVNAGEGFNLRRDVYIRMANMVKLMRQHDPSWILVLPPFTNLYHWRSVIDQDRVPWSAFFDLPSLRKLVPVIEMKAFLATFTGNEGSSASVAAIIDQYYQLQHDKEFFKTQVWKEGAWLSECNEDPELRLINGVYRGRFNGYTDLAAKRFECVTASADIEVFANWLLSNANFSVVMLGHGEVVIHGKYSEWSEQWWTARRSMRYAPELVAIANQFRSEQLNSNDEKDGTILPEDWLTTHMEPGSATGGPYICAHWRRADFVIAYPDKSPGPSAAARQLTKLLKKAGVTDVFLSTDTFDHEVLRLTKLLEPDGYRVFRYRPERSTLIKIRDGGVAIVDQIICSHARMFIGTYSSTFSFRIHEDRLIMGFSAESTFNRFCGDNETESACDQPTNWKVLYPISSQKEEDHANHEEL